MKKESAYIRHIYDSIKYIIEDTSTGKKAFFENRMIRDAVIRNFEILGEASKKVSDKIKSENPDIPWKQMAGMRDKLIHAYFSIDYNLVWDVVENEIPKIKEKFDLLLKKFP